MYKADRNEMEQELKEVSEQRLLFPIPSLTLSLALPLRQTVSSSQDEARQTDFPSFLQPLSYRKSGGSSQKLSHQFLWSVTQD